jgi:Leucine-rich repeat (LRR) protein
MIAGTVLARYQVPDLCTWDVISNETNKMAVTCRLRTLLAESTTVSSIQVEGTFSLNLECNDQIFFESVLTPKMFHSLHQLDTLTINNCKVLEIPVDAFDGLRDLKRLNVHTRNKNWSSTKFMELVPGSFDGLKELQSLNLSDNNIQSIPEDAFCSLVNLQSLNLSRNNLRSLETLGLIARRTSSDPDLSNSRIECSGGTDIKTLDLSHNHFRTLQQYSGLTKLRRLQNLHLQDNELTDIAPDSLTVLSSLRLLNLSSNHLEVLPETLFSNSKEIREIYLQNNGLYQVPKRLFNRLEQLVVLNLSNNKINQIDDEPFVGLIRLVVLDLSRNALTHIKSKFFKDLLVLQILDLRNNSIGYIEDNAFLPLYNLHTLNLAENRLHQISANLFNGLFVLSKLILSNNLIVSVNVQAFKNCSALKELDLNSNAITEVPAALTELSFLRTLDLGENQITTLKNGSFKNMESLTGLRLVDNGIGNLSDGMFWDLPNLQVLNLSKNKVQQISQGTFTRNTQLQAIRLDGNFLTDINGVFVALINLLWLNLSNNHLVWFDYAMVPRSLKWLDIHGNYIENLNNYYGLQEELNIRTLDASHNRITEISDLSIPNSVELVFINNNFISAVKVNTFFEKSSLARVDMYANEITKLEINALRLSPVPSNRTLPEFYIGGNPFECDCSMDWLPLINNMTQLRQHPKVMDLENVMCKISHSRGTQLVSATSVPSSQFLCRYETHCFTVCKCCEFDACDCEMTCPGNCSCYHDQTWNTNVVDCSRQRSQQVPSRIPMDATHVYLDGNNLGELSDHVFIGRKNMVTLFLNDSKINAVQNYTFNGLNALQVLHLESNHITKLHGFEFEQLTLLKELYLQNNEISFINNITFLPLRFLQILRLDGNRLMEFPIWQLQANSYLVEVSLSGNRWQCRCQFRLNLVSLST